MRGPEGGPLGVPTGAQGVRGIHLGTPGERLAREVTKVKESMSLDCHLTREKEALVLEVRNDNNFWCRGLDPRTQQISNYRL